MDLHERSTVLLQRAALDEVVDSYEDADQLRFQAAEVAELVSDEVLGRETVDGGICDLNFAAGFLRQACCDD
jgi:hypothetical protein